MIKMNIYQHPNRHFSKFCNLDVTVNTSIITRNSSLDKRCFDLLTCIYKEGSRNIIANEGLGEHPTECNLFDHQRRWEVSFCSFFSGQVSCDVNKLAAMGDRKTM